MGLDILGSRRGLSVLVAATRARRKVVGGNRAIDLRDRSPLRGRAFLLGHAGIALAIGRREIAARHEEASETVTVPGVGTRWPWSSSQMGRVPCPGWRGWTGAGRGGMGVFWSGRFASLVSDISVEISQIRLKTMPLCSDDLAANTSALGAKLWWGCFQL